MDIERGAPRWQKRASRDESARPGRHTHGLLRDMQDAGLVTMGSRPLSMERGIQIYRPYVLTDEGLARAHEPEAEGDHFPPNGDES